MIASKESLLQVIVFGELLYAAYNPLKTVAAIWDIGAQ